MNSEINPYPLLGGSGPFAASQASFRPRASQQQMAALVKRAIDECNHCVIEAPSGLGKTWAYLVPLLSQNNKAVISTASHYLQTQLYQRDIPAVLQVLQLSKSIALLKGRHNYLCPFFLKQWLDDSGSVIDKVSANIRIALAGIWQRFRESGNGDLTHLNYEKSLLPYLSCPPEQCLGKSCPDYQLCPLMLARQHAEQADIVIVNHSLLLSASVQDGEDNWRSADVFVIDEAHKLVDFNQQAQGSRMSSRQLFWFFKRLKLAAQRHAAEDAAMIGYVQGVERWLKALGSQLPSTNRYSQNDHKAVVARIIGVFEIINQWFLIAKERDYSLQQLAIQGLQINQTLRRIHTSEGLCWVKHQGHSSSYLLHNTPVELLDDVRHLLADSDRKTWVLTSATLSVAHDASGFLRKLGVSPAHFFRLSSPFDFQQQARLYLGSISSMPQSADYYPQFSEQLIEFVKCCPGRVLVLFSSYEALSTTAALLSVAPLFINQERFLLQQQKKHQQSYSQLELVDEFCRHQQAVLLATGSFWEGVDLSGAQLSAVVIDKLPFVSPADATVELRSNYLDHHGINSFDEWVLPDAIIKLRQGCGRLLRREGDKGVIMLADPRVRLKNYGSLFLASLDAIPICDDLDAVKHFFNVENTMNE